MKLLRKGVTTGACAQAAAKACAIMLTGQRKIKSVEIELPNGKKKEFTLVEQEFDKDYAGCGVIKDAGDENDVTDGIKIYCEIRRTDAAGLSIKGGCGIGIVTKPGLAVPVGEYAINPVPRQMILRDVSRILPQEEGFVVEISAPGGKEIAKRTFNPRLGVKGGISIIGTTGIVEPKSQDAYKASLSLELNVAKAGGHKTIFLASGYLGEKLLKDRFGVEESAIVKVGDYIGFMLGECVEKNISQVILIGHIGKLAKVAAGLFNTHSKFGDARLETIAAYAGSCGAASEIIREILGLRLAEESVEILRKNNLMLTFNKIAERVVERANEYCSGKLRLACIILSLKGEILVAEPEDIAKEDKWEKFILSE
jgi:cobalt-precorrin-5B (C1)-methyltransferase